MDHLVVITFFLLFTGISGLLLHFIFHKVKDINFVYALFFIEFMFWDWIISFTDLKSVLIPILFFSVFFKRNLSNSQKKNMRQNIWPFYIIFSMAFLWFVVKGTPPSFITSSNINLESNFHIFLSITCNVLILFLPFYIRITIKQFEKLLRNIMYLIIIQFFLLLIKETLYSELFIPFLMSTKSHFISLSKTEVLRNGMLSQYSFYIVAFGLFFLQKKYKLLLIIFAISVNLSLGGGRIDLVATLIATFLYVIIPNQKRANKLKTTFSIVGLFLLFLTLFSVSESFINKDQNNRFSQILNIQESAELDENTGNGRAAMWNYAYKIFLESPIIGNGITNTRSIDFKNVAIKNVSAGEAHQTYLSFLSVFGLLGLISFLIALRKLMRKLNQIRKIDVDNKMFKFLYVYFLITIFFYFFVSGGVSKIQVLFYFFLGYVINITLKNVKQNLLNDKDITLNSRFFPR